MSERGALLTPLTNKSEVYYTTNDFILHFDFGISEAGPSLLVCYGPKRRQRHDTV